MASWGQQGSPRMQSPLLNSWPLRTPSSPGWKSPTESETQEEQRDARGGCGCALTSTRCRCRVSPGFAAQLCLFRALKTLGKLLILSEPQFPT